MKLALAPMATLSHEALRILIHRYGDPDEYFSEMIHAPSLLGCGRYEEYYIRTAPSPEKIVWQLTGNTPEPMAEAAILLSHIGGIGVDLNMGCSAPEIARFGAGIAWMLKPREETVALVRRVRSVVEKPFRLSVKLRLGADEDYPKLLEFCRMLTDEGVELITLHPRIKSDKYGRPARRSYVAQLSSDLPIPVYGNGDVDCSANALSYMEKYPCSGVMIGRSAVQKPWIFSEIRAAQDMSGTAAVLGNTRPVIDHLEVATFFLENLRKSQPADFQLSRAHRFFFYYCDNFSFAHHIKMRIQNAKTPDEIRGLLESYFVQVPDDRFLR